MVLGVVMKILMVVVESVWWSDKASEHLPEFRE